MRPNPVPLLVCGIAAALLYVATDTLAAMIYDGYSYGDQTISELSAIDAPTRPLVIAVLTLHNALLVAFAAGVWLAAAGKRGLSTTAGLLIAIAVVGQATPSMEVRGAGPGLTDTMHIAFTSLNVLSIVAAIVVAAAALGGRFRLYSFATLAVLLVLGALAGMEGPNIAANLPTPWVGVTERISVASYLLWIAVLAVTLLRARPSQASRTA